MKLSKRTRDLLDGWGLVITVIIVLNGLGQIVTSCS